MNKEEAKKSVKNFNKADRKVLVEAIADISDKGERDELAAFFSEHQSVAEPATMETAPARRETSEQVREPKKKETKPGYIDLENMD